MTDWPLVVRIICIVSTVGLALLGACFVGLLIQAGDRRNCPCRNCERWRQENARWEAKKEKP